MIRKTLNINENTGELINETIKQFKIWDEEKGLLWRSKNYSTKMFQDIHLSDFVDNKQDFANVHLLAEHIYKQTNVIMVRVNKNKVRFATLDDISNILNLHIKNVRKFINNMIGLKIIAKRIDKVGDRKEEKYLLNPLFFFSGKYLSADLYFTFKDMLSEFLTPWQCKLFEEFGNIKGELIVGKK